MNDMKIYEVSIKSHCEAPDYEAEYTASQLKDHKCLIPWVDDYDVDEDGRYIPIASRCNGTLESIVEGYRCSSCGTIYYRID